MTRIVPPHLLSFMGTTAFKVPSRSSSTSNVPPSPIPKPLRIIKSSRKPSFPQLRQYQPLSSVDELQPADSRHTSIASVESQLSNADPRVGGNSSITLLPTPESSIRGEDTEEELSGEHESFQVTADNAPLIPKPLSRTSSVPKYSIKRKASSISVNGTGKQCAMCKTTLKSSLTTYTFPKTTPTVVNTIRSLYPCLNPSVSSETTASVQINGSLSSSHTSCYIPINSINARKVTGNAPFSHPLINPLHLEFCHACFTHLHSLHICWTCGECIERPEERVGCGWGWWHWGCLGCLLCRAPIPPPAWTSNTIILSEPPACKACLRELRDLVSVERERMGRCNRRMSPGPEMSLGVGVDGSRIGVSGARLAPIRRRRDQDSQNHDERNESDKVDSRASAVSPSLASKLKPTPILTLSRPKQWAVADEFPASLESIETHRKIRRISSNIRSPTRLSPFPNNAKVGSGSRMSRLRDRDGGNEVNRLGARRYTPVLPKWMEKLPGRRSSNPTTTSDIAAMAAPAIGTSDSRDSVQQKANQETRNGNFHIEVDSLKAGNAERPDGAGESQNMALVS